MALNPHSEQPDLGAPVDYAVDHPQEHPEDWGWHGEWGRAARIGGWLVVLAMIVMLTSTHYNRQGDVWLWGVTGSLVLILLWDIHRRRNAWRK